MKLIAKIGMVVIGVLFVIMGISTITMPEVTLVSYSWLWATMFIASGIMGIIMFFALGKQFPFRSVILLEGIVQLVLGIMLVSNGILFTTLVVLNVFRIWILFSGIQDIVHSFSLKDFGVKTWWLTLIFGIIALLIGMSSYASAVLSTTLITTFVAMGMLVTGCSLVARGFTRDAENNDNNQNTENTNA
ncbi:MAG: DUF308 domain-containing protein [Erysipelotrichaceae bacterium]|nr:DUF308 domain-containing protein [Erysipelotrichaceae bacterium]